MQTAQQNPQVFKARIERDFEAVLVRNLSSAIRLLLGIRLFPGTVRIFGNLLRGRGRGRGTGMERCGAWRAGDGITGIHTIEKVSSKVQQACSEPVQVSLQTYIRARQLRDSG